MADVPTTTEVREAYEEAMAVAVAMTRSKVRAQEIVQDAFERILTTRPWSRAERTFAQHAANTVRSLVLHAGISKSAAHDKEAHAGFHEHGIGHSAPSAEEKTLQHTDDEARHSDAEDEVDALDATLEDNPGARQVLRCRRETELTKAGDIAAKLGIPVAQVYRANEALKERLKTLRKKREKE
jgi:RNA polymerase sigma factor (sigma-70 family)